MHAVELDALRGVIFLNPLDDGLSCEFFGRWPARLSFRGLENWIREDGEVILIFNPFVLVLVAVVVDVETEALLFGIFPIDARLCVAFMIGWKGVGLLGRRERLLLVYNTGTALVHGLRASLVVLQALGQSRLLVRLSAMAP